MKEIYVYKQMFGATDEMMNQLITDYITYVEEITGMVTKPNT